MIKKPTRGLFVTGTAGRCLIFNRLSGRTPELAASKLAASKLAVSKLAVSELTAYLLAAPWFFASLVSSPRDIDESFANLGCQVCQSVGHSLNAIAVLFCCLAETLHKVKRLDEVVVCTRTNNWVYGFCNQTCGCVFNLQKDVQ